MSRRAAKVTEDEVRRMVKAVVGLGLAVSSVDFDGSRVSVNIGYSGETRQPVVDDREEDAPLPEPKL